MKNSKLTIKVVNYIINQIANEHWLPGMRVMEKEIANSTGASRSTIRYAISTLIGQGILDSTSHGVIVPNLDDKDLRDLFEFRTIIEVAAVGLVCDRASDNQLKKITSCVAKMEKALEIGALIDFMKSDEEFHQQLADASGNERIIQIMPVFRLQTVKYRSRHMLLAGSPSSRLKEEHKLISKMLLARTKSKAMEAMDSHLKKTSEAILAIIKDETRNLTP
jgi:DNA-binding GntR family transcriptional regulator